MTEIRSVVHSLSRFQSLTLRKINSKTKPNKEEEIKGSRQDIKTTS